MEVLTKPRTLIRNRDFFYRKSGSNVTVPEFPGKKECGHHRYSYSDARNGTNGQIIALKLRIPMVVSAEYRLVSFVHFRMP